MNVEGKRLCCNVIRILNKPRNRSLGLWGGCCPELSLPRYLKVLATGQKNQRLDLHIKIYNFPVSMHHEYTGEVTEISVKVHARLELQNSERQTIRSRWYVVLKTLLRINFTTGTPWSYITYIRKQPNKIITIQTRFDHAVFKIFQTLYDLICDSN